VAKPRRIQRKRVKGWRLPEGARCVTRPGRFGNPFTLEWARLADPDMTDAAAREYAVRAFGAWLTDDGWASGFRSLDERRAWILANVHTLAGLDLACFCPLPADGETDYCHARVLIDLANHPLLYVEADGDSGV